MLKKALIASALLAAFAGASAQTANFGLTGIVTPGACSITISGGGITDYGTMTAATIKAKTVDGSGATQRYSLGALALPINVSCPSPTLIALGFTDNKPAQKVSLGDANDLINFGISDGAGTTAIGMYNVSFTALQLNGAPVGQYLSAQTGTTGWSTTVAGFPGLPASYARPGYSNTFSATAGSTTPSPVTTLTGNFNTGAALLKSYVDSATNQINFQGSGLITVYYI